MKKLIFSSLVLIFFLLGCKKNEEVTPISLQGKWSIVDFRYLEMDNGSVIYDDNYTGTAADYLEFRPGTLAYFFMNGYADIIEYEILPENRVLIDGEIYSIQLLTAHGARLYSRTTLSATEYYEVTMNLKR